MCLVLAGIAQAVTVRFLQSGRVLQQGMQQMNFLTNGKDPLTCPIHPVTFTDVPNASLARASGCVQPATATRPWMMI